MKFVQDAKTKDNFTNGFFIRFFLHKNICFVECVVLTEFQHGMGYSANKKILVFNFMSWRQMSQVFQAEADTTKSERVHCTTFTPSTSQGVPGVTRARFCKILENFGKFCNNVLYEVL